MNCDAVKEMLWRYLDQETTAEETVKIEEHLKSCADCRKELELQQELMEMLSGLPEEELPDGFHDELMQKLKAEAAPNVVSFPQKKKKQPMFKQWGMIAAAVLMITAAGGVNGMLEMRESQTAAVTEMKTTEKVEMAEDSADATISEAAAVEEKAVGAADHGKQAAAGEAEKNKKPAEAKNDLVYSATTEDVTAADMAAVPDAASLDSQEEETSLFMARTASVQVTDRMVLTVEDVSLAMEAVQKAIAEAGGHEESAAECDMLTVIPKETFADFVQTLEGIGALEWTEQGDLTEAYHAIEITFYP